MPGSSFYVSLNGRRFALPEDLEPTVTIGGPSNKSVLRNGDGTALPQKTFQQGSVRGLTPRLSLANGDLESLQAISGKTGISMVYSGPDGVFTGTGFIDAGDEGIKMNQGNGTAEAFAFVCENGQPLTRR
jgi:hypothetical protein